MSSKKKKHIKTKKLIRDTKNFLKGKLKKRLVVYKGTVTNDDIEDIIEQMD